MWSRPRTAECLRGRRTHARAGTAAFRAARAAAGRASDSAMPAMMPRLVPRWRTRSYGVLLLRKVVKNGCTRGGRDRAIERRRETARERGRRRHGASVRRYADVAALECVVHRAQ